MHPSLAGCRAKIARAQHHLAAIEPQVRSFVQQQPYTVVPVKLKEETTDDGGYRIVYSAQFHTRIKPPLTLSTLLGDCIHNYRSTLDHLVWGLARLQVDEVPATIQWPIYATRIDYHKPNKGPRRVKVLSCRHQRMIELEQPYHRINRLADDPLWLLGGLSNTDKHRLLTPAGQAHQGWAKLPGMRRGDEPGVALFHTREFGGVNDGDEVARYAVLNPKHPEAQPNLSFSFGVAPPQTEPSGHTDLDLITALHLIDAFVTRIVDLFEPEFI